MLALYALPRPPILSSIPRTYAVALVATPQSPQSPQPCHATWAVGTTGGECTLLVAARAACVAWGVRVRVSVADLAGYRLCCLSLTSSSCSPSPGLALLPSPNIFVCSQMGDDLYNWSGFIRGPDDSPYEGGTFQLVRWLGGVGSGLFTHSSTYTHSVILSLLTHTSHALSR